jgi:hypothetical protein
MRSIYSVSVIVYLAAAAPVPAFLAAAFFSFSARALAIFSVVAFAPLSTNPLNLPIQWQWRDDGDIT